MEKPRVCVYLKKKATSHLFSFVFFLCCFCNLHKHLTNNKKKVKEKYFALVLAYIYILCV